MKKISLVLIALIVIISSCNKDDQNIGQNIVCQNSKGGSVNPFNKIGERHNDILYAIGKMSNFPNNSWKEEYEYMLTYLESIGAHSENEWSYYDSLAQHFNDKQSISDMSLELLNTNMINGVQYEYLDILNNIIVKYIEDNKLYNLKIDQIETVFISENRISDADKFIIWGAFSTARYSANFWFDARVNSSNPWYISVAKNAKDQNPPGYTGSKTGEAWADTKGWIHGFFHPRANQGCWDNAGRESTSWSRIYRDINTPK